MVFSHFSFIISMNLTYILAFKSTLVSGSHPPGELFLPLKWMMCLMEAKMRMHKRKLSSCQSFGFLRSEHQMVETEGTQDS